MAIPRNSQRTLKDFVLYGVRLGVALILAFLISQFRLDYFESFFYDARVRLRPPPKNTNSVVNIAITPKTIEKLSGNPGFQEHSALLERLKTAQPKAVVYDMDPTNLKGSQQEKIAFINVAKNLPSLVFLTSQLGLKGEESPRLTPPFEKLRLVPAPISSDSSNFAKDSVTRRFLIQYQDQKMAHIELAQLFSPRIDIEQAIRGEFEFLSTRQALIQFRPPGSIQRFSFEEVLNKNNLSELKNKIIILGEDTQLSLENYARTPYSRESVGMTAMEVHGNIIETLIRNDSPVKAPAWFDGFWIALISILTVYVVFSVKPTIGLLILIGSVAGFSIFNFLVFWLFNYWMDLAHPLLAVFLCYYFLIPYRLIIENRHRWEIYQKHKILQQVEELKSNFISMMSHDLKTPIARIQGMTDAIELDPNPLSSRQRESLDTIRSSGNDLLKFISSILQQSRIESEQIQLHLVSRDINELLKLAIQQNEFLAKLKKIKFQIELETLFPIRMDAELVRQVFSNLIENAVKYSPEETKVLISSEEADGFVIVQVADQGPGIPPEELPHIFMKFFRSRNAKASAVKGSGLGLYLAKYFIELHNGSVSVESSYGQGTTFTVKLPIATGGTGNVESTRR